MYLHLSTKCNAIFGSASLALSLYRLSGFFAKTFRVPRSSLPSYFFPPGDHPSNNVIIFHSLLILFPGELVGGLLLSIRFLLFLFLLGSRDSFFPYISFLFFLPENVHLH